MKLMRSSVGHHFSLAVFQLAGSCWAALRISTLHGRCEKCKLENIIQRQLKHNVHIKQHLMMPLQQQLNSKH